ncbi:hypothetical protein [Photorhabdus temperata]|nr:hypothetical protein [Photorhabdus temperata]
MYNIVVVTMPLGFCQAEPLRLSDVECETMPKESSALRRLSA